MPSDTLEIFYLFECLRVLHMSYSSEHFDNGWQHMHMPGRDNPDWETAAKFKATYDASRKCKCVISIRTAVEPFSTGRPMYIV
jgi:hypothetical protein